LFLFVPYAGIIRIRFNGFNLRHCVLDFILGFFQKQSTTPVRYVVVTIMEKEKSVKGNNYLFKFMCWE